MIEERKKGREWVKLGYNKFINGVGIGMRRKISNKVLVWISNSTNMGVETKSCLPIECPIINHVVVLIGPMKGRAIKT